MPLPVIDTVVLHGRDWISARFSDLGRWTDDLAEAKHLQEQYAGIIPEGVTILRESVPENGIELLAAPMRASQHDPSARTFKMKLDHKTGQIRSGYVNPNKRRRHRKHVPGLPPA